MLSPLKLLVLIFPVLLSVAFVTLLERKLLSLVGVRVGPNKVTIVGMLQPIGDAVKLMNKSFSYTSNLSLLFFYFSSAFTLFCSLFLWSLYCSEPQNMPFSLSFVLFMIVLSLNCLGAILCGWSSYSKYALLGSLRGVAQLISYESVLYLLIFFSLFLFDSLSLYSHSCYLGFPLVIVPPLLYVWLPTILAELNRTPFDFSEGESELVSGFNTEFGSQPFTFIFLSEYSSIMFFSLFSSMFLGFSLFPVGIFFMVFFFIIWIRSVLPRLRFDKLMMTCWKFYVPGITLFFLLVISY